MAHFNDVLGVTASILITSSGGSLPNYFSSGELEKCSSTGVYSCWPNIYTASDNGIPNVLLKRTHMRTSHLHAHRERERKSKCVCAHVITYLWKTTALHLTLFKTAAKRGNRPLRAQLM